MPLEPVDAATRDRLRQNGKAPLVAEPRTIADVLGAFERWLYLVDRRPLLAVLSAVAANYLDGDPVWLVLVGPPGGGKTEPLRRLKDYLTSIRQRR